MNMLRKWLLLTVVALIVVSCAGKSGSSQAAKPEVNDSLMLVLRVNNIYDAVAHHYACLDSIRSGQINPLEYHVNLDSMFCSADWREWTSRTRAYDDIHSAGSVGFFEADYWIMGQDWQNLSIDNVAVTSLTDSTALVDLSLNNCNNVTLVRLAMVKEQEEWKIDDFIDVSSDFDWKKGMKEYMKENE